MPTTAALIDDNRFARQRIRALLEQDGVQVLEYEPDRRGIDAIDTARADVIVTDIFMPDCDGLEILRQARRHRPGLPVVVYSRGVQSYVQVAEKLGADVAIGLQRATGLRELAEAIRRLAVGSTPSGTSSAPP